ncbi:hypothetical protein Sjap_021184 [Stephania japonica]|uniref:Uncharacterized protein n=1 Tax=Stephania japonica TaxID=461633 RepID=A0AAP0F250_9MAGN
MRTRYWQESGDQFSYSQGDGNNQLAHRPYVSSRLSHQINSRFVQAITDAHLYVSRVQEKSPYRGPDVAFSKVGPVVESLGMRVPTGPWLILGGPFGPRSTGQSGRLTLVNRSRVNRPLTDQLVRGEIHLPHPRRPWREHKLLLDPDHHHPPSLPRDGGDLRRLAKRSPPLWPAAVEEKVETEGCEIYHSFGPVLATTPLTGLPSTRPLAIASPAGVAVAAETTTSATAAAADLSSHAALTPANLSYRAECSRGKGPCLGDLL